MADGSPSVMRRKAGAGRPLPEIGAPTATRILRSALMQAGEDVAALTIVAGQPEETRVTLDPMVEGIEAQALMCLLEGPQAAYGLAILDPQAMAALIEVQTTGRVRTRPADVRAPTRTDAIMCADFIDRTLELLEQGATDAELDLLPVLAGFRYALALPEPRAISLTLPDIPYRQFSVSLDLGRGAKQGKIDVVLPYDGPGRGRGGAGLDPQVFTEALGDVVGTTTARLLGTLHRIELPLAEVAALEVGSLVPIPKEALSQVAIEDIDGRTIMRGRLGQQGGNRALRIGVPAGAGAVSIALEPRDMPAALAAPGGTIPLEDTLGGMPDLADAGHLGDTSDNMTMEDMGEPGPLDLDLGAHSDGLEALSDVTDDVPDLDDLPDLASLGTE